MKKLIWALPLALIAFTLVSCSEVAPTATEDMVAASKMGDIAPRTVYKLNIIGVSKDKTAAMDDNNGRRIFVQLYNDPEDGLTGGKNKGNTYPKNNKIFLTPNNEGIFGVLDANATDSDGAEFTMPVNVAGGYEVWARALGKPGGSAKITTCAEETEETMGDDGVDTWCSLNSVVLTRVKGKDGTAAQNVTNELLFINLNVSYLADPALAECLAGAEETNFEGDYPIFGPCLENYFWDYDNNGLKLLQLWFTEVAG